MCSHLSAHNIHSTVKWFGTKFQILSQFIVPSGWITNSDWDSKCVSLFRKTLHSEANIFLMLTDETFCYGKIFFFFHTVRHCWWKKVRLIWFKWKNAKNSTSFHSKNKCVLSGNFTFHITKHQLWQVIDL